MPKKPTFGIISDTHNHAWSAFAKTNPDGVNSRLQIILDETMRAAHAVKKAGGDTLYHAGDMFHVRGKLSPSVLNATRDCYTGIIQDLHMKVIILAGNHDLEGENAERLGSAVTAMEGAGCKVINNYKFGIGAGPHVVMVPWFKRIVDLKAAIEAVSELDRPGCDLIIHAPIDGVIPGLPDHGLDAEYLAALGYDRVFAGHYHHYQNFGNNVYSIGALTHHSWSDVGSKAGFLIVTDDEVKWYASRAPAFIAVDSTTDLDDLQLTADGNYVKAKIGSDKSADVEGMRAFLMNDCKAAGCIILSEKAGVVSRLESGVAVASSSLEDSVSAYIISKALPNEAELRKLCDQILTEAKAVA